MLHLDKKTKVYKVIREIIGRRFEYETVAKLKKGDVLHIRKVCKVDFEYVIGCLQPLQEEGVLTIVSDDRRHTRRDDVIALFQTSVPAKYWDRLDPEHDSIH